MIESRGKRFAYFFLAWACLTVFANCSTQTSPGVEIGNPNLEGKAVQVIPATGTESYLVSIVDDTTARVQQLQISGAALRVETKRPRWASALKISKNSSVLLDTVLVPYTISNGSLTLNASFANGRMITLELAVENDNFASASLDVDGVAVSSTIDIEETTVATCSATVTNPALRLSNGVCTRLNACNSSIDCTGCLAQVGEIDFFYTPGGPTVGSPTMTFSELADLINTSNPSVDYNVLNACLTAISEVACSTVINTLEDVNFSSLALFYSVISADTCEVLGQ